MFRRWRPHGPGPAEVIQVRDPDVSALLARASAAIEKLMFDRGGK
jgi:hypothetical protein